MTEQEILNLGSNNGSGKKPRSVFDKILAQGGFSLKEAGLQESKLTAEGAETAINQLEFSRSEIMLNIEEIKRKIKVLTRQSKKLQENMDTKDNRQTALLLPILEKIETKLEDLRKTKKSLEDKLTIVEKMEVKMIRFKIEDIQNQIENFVTMTEFMKSHEDTRNSLKQKLFNLMQLKFRLSNILNKIELRREAYERQNENSMELHLLSRYEELLRKYERESLQFHRIELNGNSEEKHNEALTRIADTRANLNNVARRLRNRGIEVEEPSEHITLSEIEDEVDGLVN